MIKIFINADGSIAKREPAEHKEVYADFDVSDSIVIDEITWEITLYPNSKQWQDRLKGLRSKKDLNDLEKAELAYLIWDTYADKQ